MDYEESRVYLDEMSGYGSVLGLDNMREMLDRLGNPQKDLKFIHISGTNGKGSVLAYVSTVLTTAGYKVGRYVSPTLFCYEEKIQINGKMITKEALARQVTVLAKVIKEMVQAGKQHPTIFEVETVLGFLYFKEQKCDFVVLETGLGGLMDATNIIDTSIMEIIASISRDHMGILGNSLEEIAYNKAGIIKPDTAVVTCSQEEGALRTIQRVCQEKSAKLYVVNGQDIRNVNYGLLQQTFDYRNWKQVTIPLAGTHQIENAALALLAVETLKNLGVQIADSAVYKGMKETKWKGRFSLLSEKPLVIMDGAHNEGAAKVLTNSLQQYFPNKQFRYIMGVFEDKEYEKIVQITAPFAKKVTAIETPDNPRALKKEKLAEVWSQYLVAVKTAESVEEALRLNLEQAQEDEVIVAFGSLSFLGELTDAMRKVREKMDYDKIVEGVKLILEGIGEDVNREGLLETPDRIARMYRELAGGMQQDAGEHLKKRFLVEHNDLVLEKDITFYSLCEHHMLPFYGKVHIAYIPNGEVVGLSKIARTVEVFARRLQIQERMTAQIADAFEENLKPQGVMVMVEAEHMCMTMRGIKKPGAKTITYAARGVFEQDETLKNRFFDLVK